MNRRSIEETFPIQEISEESSAEKNIRKGHHSTVHVWWARRPVLASRATIFASLINHEKNEKKHLSQLKIITELGKWENSDNSRLLEDANKEILKNFDGKPPKILDPFSGGGSIPLEAIRLGCEVFANDYNPVACFNLKCVLDIPMKFASKLKQYNQFNESKGNRFIEELEKWQKWVYEKTDNEIRQFYPKISKELEPLTYFWCKKIKCPNPKCGKDIPLIEIFWLLKNKNQQIALFPFKDKNQVKFKIVGTDYEKFPSGFDPSNGTVNNAIATCLFCNSRTKTREFLSSGNFSEEIICIIVDDKGKKKFVLANNKQNEILIEIEKNIKNIVAKELKKGKFSPIPNELIPTPDNKEYQPGGLYYNFLTVVIYGQTKWGDLFNFREQLMLLTFSKYIRSAYFQMLKDGTSESHANAICCYLVLVISKFANYGSKITHLNYLRSSGIANTFGRQVLSNSHSYVEPNPFSPKSPGYFSNTSTINSALEKLSRIISNPAKISNNSATSLPYENEFFDAVITDPPYYDNIAYSYLSDFFYVWLRRILYDIEPDLFSTPVTPKSSEAISELPLIRGLKKIDAEVKHPYIKNKASFENSLGKSFLEIHRVLKQNGIAVIVYAHKSTDGWETLIKSLLKSGLIVTAAWPINTERQGRLEANNTAALSSSIYIVCRKWKKEPHGSYSNVKKQMQDYLDSKLDFLWNQKIRGADFFISAIGSAIEVFGKYETITDNADNEIQVSQLLDDVRKIVSEHAIKKVLRGDISGEISSMTRFYLLWRSAYGQSRVPYDDARKLMTSLGIPQSELNKGFVKQEKDVVRVLGPEDRSIDEIKDPVELIDVMHKALLLWRTGDKEESEKLLVDTGFAKSDSFRRISQAISESLSDKIDEKRWIQAFLTGFSEGKKDGIGQTKLF